MLIFVALWQFPFYFYQTAAFMAETGEQRGTNHTTISHKE
jgi:hypothetical protein